MEPTSQVYKAARNKSRSQQVYEDRCFGGFLFEEALQMTHLVYIDSIIAVNMPAHGRVPIDNALVLLIAMRCQIRPQCTAS